MDDARLSWADNRCLKPDMLNCGEPICSIEEDDSGAVCPSGGYRFRQFAPTTHSSSERKDDGGGSIGIIDGGGGGGVVV
uniref:Uncharacterized protein n=1 Tax=Onchocerca volvulus TaxID=6282 RepID=A0A8R1XSN7_ONCVO